MKRLFAFVIAAAFAAPAHALLGIGDITFDPTTYGEVAKQYEQMVKMYNTAKDQLDGLVKIEKTIKDAQQAYETLASGDLKNSITGLTSGGMNVKSAADLRAELANIESKGGQSASYVAYQMSLIKQLDDLAKLQKASATNAQQATAKNNQATSAAIAAQSTSTLAALAAAEEQRRVQQDYQNQKNAKALVDNMKDSTKIYDAIGK